MRRVVGVVLTLVACWSASALPAARAETPLEQVEFTVTMPDGVEVFGFVAGRAPVTTPRPTIIEFSPYAPEFRADANPGDPSTGAELTTMPFGDAFNYVFVHVRGTGRSGGSWDVFGPAEQADIRTVADWVCDQPWSAGRLAIWGSSASAIAAYNAMRRAIPCVRTAVLLSGTSDMYRDVAYPGGIPNLAVPNAFLGLVAAPYAADLPQRLEAQPASVGPSASGFASAGPTFLQHDLDDDYWRSRSFARPEAPYSIPLLIATGFYDIEARGGVEAFMLTRHLGSQLVLTGAHEGGLFWPALQHRATRWYRHALLGDDNGVENEPKVTAWVARGGVAEQRRGDVVEITDSHWPLRRTIATPLYLAGGRSGSAASINDGTLALAPPPAGGSDSYPFNASDPLRTDRPLSSLVSGAGAAVADHPAATPLFDLRAEEPHALTYTTDPFDAPVDVVGPASLRLFAATTAPETDYYAVVADVHPDGTAKAVASGRLRSTFPGVDASRSVNDKQTGLTLRPWNVFDAKTEVPATAVTEYHVELWPVGNRFELGHRLRLYIVGTPAGTAAPPPYPAVNTIFTGGPTPSALVLPVVATAEQAPP